MLKKKAATGKTSAAAQIGIIPTDDNLMFVLLSTWQSIADDILHEASSLYDKWPKMPLDTKRKIAESLVEKIVIGEEAIDINFTSMPSSGELCKSQQGVKAGMRASVQTILVLKHRQHWISFRPLAGLLSRYGLSVLRDYCPNAGCRVTLSIHSPSGWA